MVVVAAGEIPALLLTIAAHFDGFFFGVGHFFWWAGYDVLFIFVFLDKMEKHTKKGLSMTSQ